MGANHKPVGALPIPQDRDLLVVSRDPFNRILSSQGALGICCHQLPEKKSGLGTISILPMEYLLSAYLCHQRCLRRGLFGCGLMKIFAWVVIATIRASLCYCLDQEAMTIEISFQKTMMDLDHGRERKYRDLWKSTKAIL